MVNSEMEKLEKLRQELLQDERLLEFYDYGAGSPKDMRTKEEMYRGVKVCKKVSERAAIGLKNEWMHWLFDLVKNKRPKKVLELGTCLGFSAMTMALASPESEIYTIEGAKELAEIAMENYRKMQIKNIIQVIGRFQDHLEELLKKLNRIDFAFIDGHHDKDATIEYYSKIRLYMAKDSIMVFDDISWSEGMKEAWKFIVEKEGIENCEDLGRIGLCHIR